MKAAHRSPRQRREQPRAPIARYLLHVMHDEEEWVAVPLRIDELFVQLGYVTGGL
jgi:hypothetical protein